MYSPQLGTKRPVDIVESPRPAHWVVDGNYKLGFFNSHFRERSESEFLFLPSEGVGRSSGGHFWPFAHWGSEGHTLTKVSDIGIGMDLTTDRQQTIINMYGRFNGALEGKGMVLYLVKARIVLMEGKIEILSQKEVGTTFILHFKK
ncbi:ATP-binding protein [Flagellimonas halotolerans]|uniref:ATP-binding protein n=1 Tax=Flagellimonas halotolerans TaxID=3112164 RepID=A0ABU6IV92_9FLAO|nr:MULTISPECIES: ATP-binding protein [unclassified Allomuricauda]MEC3966932.1 ATP-binding protein [Muricauda sp. SYSU M86414]MEC4266795.1 ATP-binding protein [Muricauda sp. SYSU M84420]